MEKKQAPMTILVCGMGIIGGSIAKALKAFTPHRVLGMNRSPQPLEKALACGAIDAAVDEVSLSQVALVFLCANYNDALQANVSACINRLTALFRRNFFWDKKIFGIVVSGYSGGDLIARQLIGSLTMNKSFQLPPDFSLLVTANDRGSLVKLPGIEEQAARFARRILSEVTGELPCTTE